MNWAQCIRVCVVKILNEHCNISFFLLKFFRYEERTISTFKTCILSEMISWSNQKEIYRRQILSYQVHYFEEKKKTSDLISTNFQHCSEKWSEDGHIRFSTANTPFNFKIRNYCLIIAFYGHQIKCY